MSTSDDLPTTVRCVGCSAIIGPNHPPPKYCAQCGRPLLQGQTTRLQVASFASTLIERLRARRTSTGYALADEGTRLVDALALATDAEKNAIVSEILGWNRRAHDALSLAPTR